MTFLDPIDKRNWAGFNYPGPITRRCPGCGAPMQWYGTKHENGFISVGHHDTYEMHNTADGNMCSRCYSHSLEDREFAKEIGKKITAMLEAERTPCPSSH